MRTGAVLLVVALAGASASLALASSSAGGGKPSPADAVTADKGKPEDKGKPRTGEGCRPRVQVILKGTLVTPPGADGTSFTLNVTRANAHGRVYVAGAQPVKVVVDARTIFRRQGAKTAASLLAGDRVLVQARACKSDLVSAAATSTSTALPAVQLTALRVTAHPAKSADEGSGSTSS
jgi:hypothetical protein